MARPGSGGPGGGTGGDSAEASATDTAPEPTGRAAPILWPEPSAEVIPLTSTVPGAVRSRPTVPPAVVTRYRVMAYVTGVLLLLLVFVAMPLKYGLGNHALDFVAFAHGWLYVLYLFAAFHLSHVARWSAGRTIWVLLAGTVPFASFFTERRVVREMVRPTG